jgi:hypothetical protein
MLRSLRHPEACEEEEEEKRVNASLQKLSSSSSSFSSYSLLSLSSFFFQERISFLSALPETFVCTETTTPWKPPQPEEGIEQSRQYSYYMWQHARRSHT